MWKIPIWSIIYETRCVQKQDRSMKRLLAGACTEMIMWHIDLRQLIQNNIIVKGDKHKLVNDLSSCTTC